MALLLLVTLPDTETDTVLDVEPLRLPVNATDCVKLRDIDLDDEAPKERETVEDAVCVAVILDEAETDGTRDVDIDALLLEDAPKVAETVFEGVRGAVSVRDAVLLRVRVNDGVALRERERVTVTVYDGDMVRLAVAPTVSEPVDVAVCVAVSELDGEVDTEMLYEGDAAQKAGTAG